MKYMDYYKNGENVYCVYLTYEDYYGGDTFRSYAEMQKYGDLDEGQHGTLVGWIYSHYWGSAERIDTLNLQGRPRIAEVKQFVENCRTCLSVCDDEQISGKEYRKLFGR